MLRFTCGERKIYSTIKKSQDKNMIEGRDFNPLVPGVQWKVYVTF